MKKQIIAILITSILVAGIIIPLVLAADTAISNIRFEEEGNYKMIAAGVGIKGEDSGDISIDIPGDVVVAYLYWSGIGYETLGDNQVLFNSATINADDTYGPEPWYDDYFHYVYVAEVTTFVSSGDNTYSVEELNMPYINYGAGLVVVYEDTDLPLVKITILDGLDGFWFDWDAPVGPDSEVFSYDFDSSTNSRDGEIFIFVGGTEHDDRPNEIYIESGTTIKPTNLIPASGGDLDGDYPLVGSDGPAWDTYKQDVTIDPGDEWLAGQIESIDSFEDPPMGDPHIGRGTSGLVIASGFVLPVEPKLAGLSPGFWKHNIRVALEYPGRYSVPHDGEPRIDYDIISGYASAIGVTLEEALEALTAKGSGSEAIRLEMCNAFNEIAGYETYSD